MFVVIFSSVSGCRARHRERRRPHECGDIQDSAVLSRRRGIGILRIRRALKSRRKFGASRRIPGSRKRVNPENFQYSSGIFHDQIVTLPSHKPAWDRSTKKAPTRRPRKGRNIHRPFAAQCRTLTTTMDTIMSVSGQETPTCDFVVSFISRTSVAHLKQIFNRFSKLVKSITTSGCVQKYERT